jgi:hypothetical protein
MTKEQALMAVMMTNFQHNQLERVLDIKQEVDAGRLLMDYDLDFMAELCGDAQDSIALIRRFPEYQEVYIKAIGLFREIAYKAMENERR